MSPMVPMLRYWAEYMYMDGDVNENGLYSPEYCIRRGTIALGSWRSSAQRCPSYLVSGQGVPRFERDKPVPDTILDGGLCLLTRLKRLRVIDIDTDAVPN
ncbi:hypothetical protein BGZ58_000380 [Dissophora ornata]|nr:hypothetical protein BGZ58_000380 [Dissophora ornata]